MLLERSRWLGSLTGHHAVGGLLVAVVAGRDGVVEARSAASDGRGGEVHVGALGGLTQGQAGGHCGGQITVTAEPRDRVHSDPVGSSQ